MMRSNVLLWMVQGLLAVIFLFAGGMKLILPLETLKGSMPLPGLFMRFIGVAEVLGAIGLVLPWLLWIRPILTPVAAGGLVIITTGATVITLLGGGVAPALFPLIVAVLSASVAHGRWRPAAAGSSVRAAQLFCALRDPDTRGESSRSGARRTGSAMDSWDWTRFP
jgi:DoxX-like protein